MGCNGSKSLPTDYFFQVQTRGAAWQLVPALNGNNGEEKTPVQKPYEEEHQNWKLGIYSPASQPVGCWTRTRQASLCVLLMTLTLLVCLGSQSGHNGKEPSGMYLEFRRLFHRSLLCRIKQVLQTLDAMCTRCEKPYMACSLEMPEAHEPEILMFKLIV